MPIQSELHLRELVPIDVLERLQNLFKSLTGVPMAIMDSDCVPLTALDNPMYYCGSLLCGYPGALCLRRAKWNVPETQLERSLLSQHMPGSLYYHRCRGGFRDTATPIVVENQTVGYAIFARTLDSPPDIEKFRQLAVDGGMAPEVGEEVARAALVMPKERIAQVANFLQLVASLVASAAHSSIRAQQIIDMEESRESLIHMVVHDLRTPLTSIIGGLMTVQNTDYDPSITSEFIPMALSSSNTLLEMINTLLDLNKSESGKLEMDFENVDFTSIVRSAVDQVLALATDRKQELVAAIDPCCGVIVADGDKLRRVIVNILGNAVKFTPRGGHIKLAAFCVEGGLELSVADDGPGIPEEDLDVIFEKFGQARIKNQGHRHSTGIGLAFCEMIVKAHGGRILVESDLGKGCTFRVFIPNRQTAPLVSLQSGAKNLS